CRIYGRARINHDTASRGDTAFGVGHVHISTQSLTVAMQGSSKCVFRRGDEFRGGLLLSESRVEIGAGFPDFANNRVSRMRHFGLRSSKFRFRNAELIPSRETIENRQFDADSNTVDGLVTTEEWRVFDRDIQLRVTSVRVQRNPGIVCCA